MHPAPAQVSCNHQGRSAGTGDQRLDWDGGEPGGSLSPQGKTHTSTDTLLELSGNSGSCPRQQRQEAVHLFATCFIIIHIRVVIKDKALVKYGTQGAWLLPNAGSFPSTGRLRPSPPPPANCRGPSEKVPDHLLVRYSLILSSFSLTVFFFFPNPLVSSQLLRKLFPSIGQAGRDQLYII